MADVSEHVKQRIAAAVRTLGRRSPVRAAYLFGSYVDGHADEWSDIDVAAFIDGVETWSLTERTQAFIDVQKEVGFDVEPHLFPASSLKHTEPGSFAAYILRHGLRVA